MADTNTTNLNLVKPQVGSSADTWGDKLNNNFDAIDNLFSSGDLTIAHGGTGASDAATARTNLGLAIGTDVQAYDADLTAIAGLSSADGNFIVGSASGWVAESGSTVRTSLGLGSLATLGSINNSNWSGTALEVANGGTGSTTASGARTALGLVIGTNVQAYDADLSAIAGLSSADGNIIVGNGTTWVAESGATARTSLGLAIGTDVQAYDADLTTIAGLSSADGNIIIGNGTTWVVESGATARTSLGLTIGTDVQAYDADLTAIAGLSSADGNFIVGNGTTWVAESGSTVRDSLGLGSLATLSSISNSNWSGTDLSISNGGTGASTAADARTNLGATSVGSNLFTLTNPGATRFLRVNVDNTVSSLTATEFRNAIDAAQAGVFSVGSHWALEESTDESGSYLYFKRDGISQASLSYQNLFRSNVAIFDQTLSAGGTTKEETFTVNGSFSAASSFVASLSGNVLTVTNAQDSTGSNALAVGDVIWVASSIAAVPSGTKITALLTGTGGVGTYEVNAYATIGSLPWRKIPDSQITPVIQIRSSDIAYNTGQPIGRVEFWSSALLDTGSNDINTGPVAFVAAEYSPDYAYGTTDLVFGVRFGDTAVAGDVPGAWNGMRLTGEKELCIGTDSADVWNYQSGNGIVLEGRAGYIQSASESKNMDLNKTVSTAGTFISFNQQFINPCGKIANTGAGNKQIYFADGNNRGLILGGTAGYYVAPTNNGSNYDNLMSLGTSSSRFKDVYAGNATIQTSDANEKQDIAELSDAERSVAIACKSLLRKFRWKDAVEQKGDDARIHFGIIAQDLQAAFAAQGLDASKYGMFTSDTWYEFEQVVPEQTIDETLIPEHTIVMTCKDANQAPENAVQKTRLGVRYSELLAFIIAAI